MLQVSLYIAEHRLELEEEGGKDKAQVAVEEHLYFFFFSAFFTGDWPGPLEGTECS